MRIIAGKFRGKKLCSPNDAAVRPTADRVKESVFQILSDKLQGARVLDLFSGSGALGLESLSRGAEEVVFNDASKESLALTRKNASAVGGKCKTFGLDYASCLSCVTGAFDVIFCDPPYREDYCRAILTKIRERGLLKPNGVVVYESEREEVPPEGWVRADMRKYGRCRVAFFKTQEDNV